MRRLRGSALALLLVVNALGYANPSDKDKIEAVLAAVIEAYRTGDFARLGRYCAPEVTVVPADYNPPVVGWANVESRYKQAYANLTGVEMIRENTRIEERGNVAWVVYQWRFAGVAPGAQTIGAQGHTTLVLEKRRGEWLIVHNHTSALLPPVIPETPPSPRPAS